MLSTARGLFLLVFLTSAGGAQEKTFSTSDGVRFRVETVLTNLEIPWSIVFDHEGNMYFTERPGRLSMLRKGAGTPTLIATISEVRHIGEGGGKLYITTGDAAVREIAQDPNSLGGKTLRVNDDGTIPSDNPNPRSPIFAVGFRNAQGIDWHPEAGLQFQTEHGPSGFDGPGGGDEVNIVEAGKNYGWPVIHHRQTKPGYEAPLLEYTPAVAPGSGSFYRGDAFPKFKNNFFFGGLRGQRIQRIVLDPKNPRNVVSEEALLQGGFQRIRDVLPGPDGYMYFSTSNRDGRARPASGDDRIMRIVPAN